MRRRAVCRVSVWAPRPPRVSVSADPFAPHAGLPFVFDHDAALAGSLWWPDPTRGLDDAIARADVVADLGLCAARSPAALESHVRAAVRAPSPPLLCTVPQLLASLDLWPGLIAPSAYVAPRRPCSGLVLTRLLTVLRTVVEPPGAAPLVLPGYPVTPLLVVPGGNLSRLFSWAWCLVVSGLRSVHALQLAAAETLSTPAAAVRTVQTLWMIGPCPPIALGAVAPVGVSAAGAGGGPWVRDPALALRRDRAIQRYAETTARLHDLAFEGRSMRVVPVSPYLSHGRLKPPGVRVANAASLTLRLLDHVVHGLRLLGAIASDLVTLLAPDPDLVFGAPQDYRVPVRPDPTLSPLLRPTAAMDAAAALDPGLVHALLERVPDQLRVPRAALLLGERAVARAFVRWAPAMTSMVWGGSAEGDHPARCGPWLPAPTDVLHPAPDLGPAPACAVLGDAVDALPLLGRSVALTDAERAGLGGFFDR